MIIAVDGSAASGKGTLAKRLASHFELAHLDTGSLYRIVGLSALEQGLDDKNINEIQAVAIANHLDLSISPDQRIRNDEVAKMASIVAAMPSVRACLIDQQRNTHVEGKCHVQIQHVKTHCQRCHVELSVNIY